MITTEELNAVKEETKQLPHEMGKTPYMPVTNLLRQGTVTLSLYNTDIEKFREINISEEKAGKLEAIMEALRDFNSSWKDTKKEAKEARAKWEILYPQALKLKSELLTTLRFAYDEDENTLDKIKEITKGTGQDDLIQDLHDIAYVCKKNTEPFKQLNYDISLFDHCENLSSELLILQGKMNGQEFEDEEVMMLRNKAFYYLKQTLDYIRKYGKYVFRDNPERAEKYSESYFN